MSAFKLPFIRMPQEFVILLKSNMGGTPKPSDVFKVLGTNPALMMVMEKSFSEFDDGRGIEKVMSALGWSSFKDRLASLYISKSLYGKYSQKTDLEVIEEIKQFERTYQQFEVSSYARLFLLGFYIKLANIRCQNLQEGEVIQIPSQVINVLSVLEGRAERIDWLILIISHLLMSLDEALIINHLGQQKKIDYFYDLMSSSDRQLMFENLLSYGASIGEQDFVLYAKI